MESIISNEIKYNIDFLCTYHLIDEQHIKNNSIESPHDIKNTIDDISNLCFQQQLLQFFGLYDYNDTTIENGMNELFNDVKNSTGFREMIDFIRDNMKKQLMMFSLSQSNELTEHDIFVFVFSYDYFYKFHKEYCSYKNGLPYDFSNIKSY